MDEPLEEVFEEPIYKATLPIRPLIIWLVLIFIWAILWIIQIPGGYALSVFSSACLLANGICWNIYSKWKRPQLSYILYFSALWSLFILYRLVFSKGYFNSKGLRIFLTVFLISYVIYEVYKRFLIRKQLHKTKDHNS